MVTSVIPHLVFKNASDAIAFYAKAFGAKEVMKMEGPGGAIMHAEISFGSCSIYLADEWPGAKVQAPTTLGGTTVSFHLRDENVDALYNQAIGAGAESVMPPQDMFWGDRYCQVADPYGHVWSIAAKIEDVTPEVMHERMNAMSAASA